MNAPLPTAVADLAPWSSSEFEARLRALGARYHI
jgi:pyrroloquinoline-quinone synthase